MSTEQRRRLLVGRRSCLLFFLLLNDRGSVGIRDLTLDTHKVGDTAVGIAQGGNEELVPKGRSVDTVVEQADRHVVSLFNGLADAFDRLGVRLGSLQETAVTSQDLVQRVTGQVEETLTGIDNRIVGQGRIGDNKVLLSRLQSLDERKVGIVQDLVGDTLAGGQESIDVGTRAGLVEELLGAGGSKVLSNGVLEFLILEVVISVFIRSTYIQFLRSRIQNEISEGRYISLVSTSYGRLTPYDFMWWSRPVSRCGE